MVSWRSALALACIAYPWLHPFARGASATIEPLLVGLGCTTVLLALAAFSPERIRLGRGLVVGLAAAAAAVWFGDIVARGTPLPSPGALAAWVVLAGIGACAAVASLGREGSKGWSVSLIAWAWLIAGLLSTIVALAQVAGLDTLLGPFAAHSPNRQAFGNLRQKNHYASLANLALLAAAWLVLHGRPALPRWAAALSALLLCAGTAAAASRTGAVQLLLVLAVAAAWHRAMGRRAGWLLLPLGFYALSALMLLLLRPDGAGGPALLARLASDAAPNCTSRAVLWQNMIELVAQRPWTGWGWRELPYAFYAGDFDPRFCALLENAHNLPLHLAVELGLPIATATCVLLAWVVVRARPWADRNPARQLAWAVLLLLAIHSLVEYPLWYAPFQMALGLALGLLVPQGKSPAAPHWLPPSVAVAFAGLLAYAAWDYHRASQLYIAPEARSPRYQDRTLEQARASWLFAEHVDFAELAITPLNGETAEQVHRLSSELLHFSPEPRVIERNILSALRLGRDGEAAQQMKRYRAAYPADYQAWMAQGGTGR